MKRRFLSMLAAAALPVLTGPGLYAQVQDDADIVQPAPQFQDHGGVTPWFWIGAQSVFSGGYNLETGAAGFRDYGGGDNTYASFNFAFVDSRYQTPKFYQVPREIDPEAFTGKFKLLNFTTRINSWSQNEDAVENNRPAWLAEIAGSGLHLGFFTQAGALIGSLEDDTQGSNNSPLTTIAAGDKVLPLGDDDLGKTYYERRSAGNRTAYSTGSGALWYLGYEKPSLFSAYLTMLSEGNVNSDVSDDKNDAFAGALDFSFSPMGDFTDEETPITFKFEANAVSGFRWENAASDSKNAGFGVKAQGGIYLGRDNLALSPVVAFDGRIADDAHDNEFTGRFGAGLTLQLSGMRWTSDTWNELASLTYKDYTYENAQILKYAYIQAYAAYSEAEDLDALIRFEEPDGSLGFHEKLGAALEARLYNLTGEVTTNTLDWAAQGRVSYELNAGAYPLAPSLRAYLDSDAILKLRLGVEANLIPYTCFELAYTSANLNKGADGTWKPLSFYDSNFDAGRIELIVVLKSDTVRPRTPKRWNEWDYRKSSLSDM